MSEELATAIIPARLGSTRFPGKMLASDTGWPLVRHVWERAQQATRVGRVVVATDDSSIAEAVAGFGGESVMTSAEHPNGTSRLAEATNLLGLGEAEVIVNLQGDEPEIEPELIDLAVGTLAQTGSEVATVGAPFEDGQDASNPNVVKVVCDLRGRALFFSRSLIPHDRDGLGDGAAPLRHVGLYAYTAGFLRRYVELPESPAEISERLEQLRVLEHGYRIAVAVTRADHVGIDTPDQYHEFVSRWRQATGGG